MALRNIPIDMSKLEKAIRKFEANTTTTPSSTGSAAEQDELSPANLLRELKEIRANRRIKTGFQEKIYRTFVVNYG